MNKLLFLTIYYSIISWYLSFTARCNKLLSNIHLIAKCYKIPKSTKKILLLEYRYFEELYIVFETTLTYALRRMDS